MAIKTKRILLQIAFWVCILAALAFILYPQFTALKAGREKQELVAELRRQMTENAKIAERDPETAVNAVIELEENAGEEGTGAPEDGQTDGILPEDPDGEEDQAEEAADPARTEKERQTAISSILAAQTVIGIIEMEDVEILEPVVVGTGKENLKVAAGHVEGTAGIGEPGNCVICAHNGGIYGKLFRDLRKLKNGNVVKVTDVYNRTWKYEVYDSFVVEPTEVWILEDIKDDKTGGKEDADGEPAYLTLFTCENNGSMRRVIRCRLVK